MRTLLIGADGQLGTDLRRVLVDELLAVDWPQFDVRNAERVRAVLRDYRPERVVNCAAITDVDACERAAEEAFTVNALGALHVARAAEEIGAAVTFVSTDYIFGAAGARAAAYDEADLPGPINVYGASKLAGEQLTLAYNSRALVVRTCGLYGHTGARGKGTNFVETMLRLAAERKPIRVVDDQRLSPTSTAECAALMCDLHDRGAQGVYHVAARNHCTWCEFARAIFEFESLTVDLAPVGSADFPRPARRPLMSALRSVRLPSAVTRPGRTWREQLAEYLATRRARGVQPSASARQYAGQTA